MQYLLYELFKSFDNPGPYQQVWNCYCNLIINIKLNHNISNKHHDTYDITAAFPPAMCLISDTASVWWLILDLT